jgi:hypothetical protein
MSYDQSKAAAFNKARAQGLSQADALTAAGITSTERFSYALDPAGQIGPREQIVAKLGQTQGTVTPSTTAGSTDSQGRPVEVLTGEAAAQARAEEAAFEQTGRVPVTPYAQTASTAPKTITTREYTEFSTTSVSGGGSTTIVATPARPTPASQALDAQAQQTQREIEALQLANSGFGTGPQLTEQQQATNDARIFALQQQYNAQRDAAESAKIPSPPSITTVPNTTTTVNTVAFERSVEATPVSFTNDPAQISQSTETRTITRDRPVNPASDPSQFPAYDDEGNLQPGFAINNETGDTYFQGFERTTDRPFQADLDPEYAGYSVAGLTEPDVNNPANLNDPYYGLTPTQLQDLGGADPTDPYIRARLGIPQLPGSTLAPTPGFGTIKTGVPLIDNALNFLGGLFGGRTQATPPPTPSAPAVAPASDPSQFPAYDDDGNLQPGFAINEETGQPYYQGFERNTDQPVNPASDPSQFPAYDDDGNLQPGFAINDETGQPYFEGIGPPTSDSVQTLTEEETAALFEDEPTQPELLGGPPDETTTLTEEETANLFESEGYAPVEPADQGPPTEAPRLLSDEELDAIYPPTDPQEKGAIFGTRIISDEARASMSDPEAIRTQLAANAAPPPPAIISETVPLTPEQEEALFTEAENSVVEVNDAEAVPLTDEETAALFEEEQASVVEVNDAEAVPLTDEETAALFEEEQASVVEVTEAEVVPLSPEEEAALFEEEVASVVEADEALDVDTNNDEALQEPPDADVELTELAEPVDPDADPELLGGPEPEVDPFAPLEEPPDVDAEESPELLGGPEPEVDPFAPLEEPPDVNAEESPELLGGPGDEEPGEPELLGGPENVNTGQDPALSDEEILARRNPSGLSDEEILARDQANAEAAAKERAKQQATFQARYKQPGNSDWRVRLSLGPNANYLYNAGTPRGSGAGILAPLTATDGVIFPYTPNITTNYAANYEQYDLVHSNYRGVFYKNSRVGDITVRGTFTAQDTTEANYLLAVIHFFRSATKMFYGQDAERGTPPPVCLLNGLGQFQFSDHPVVISSFNYTTPNDVDYIRATNPNNYGSNLLNRRAAVASNPGGSSLAGLNRLLNALPTGLSKGAIPNVPAPSTVNQSVNNTAGATYVPTKMEIDITLIPVQTRAQVSKQFSLKGFANGDLLKGGFW